MARFTETFEAGTNGGSVVIAGGPTIGGQGMDQVTGGAFTYDNTKFDATGHMSCKVTLGASGTQSYIMWSSATTLSGLALPYFLRYYLFLTSYPTANEYLCVVRNSSLAHIAGFGITSAGRMAIYDTGPNTSPRVIGSLDIPLNQWIRVEAKMGPVSTITGSLELKWYSSPESTGTPDEDLIITNANTGASAPATVGWGLENGATSSVAWFDDVAISTTGFPGPAIPLPSLTSMSPTSGKTAGNTFIAIRGSGLSNATNCSFGGTPTSQISLVDDTKIYVLIPAHAAGVVDVVVTAYPSRTPVNATDQFTYVDPSAAPGTPTGLIAVPGNGQVTLTWTATGQPADTFTIQPYIHGSPTTKTFSRTVTDITMKTPPIRNGTAYTFTVTATNSFGDSAASAQSNIAVPSAPYVVPTPFDTGGFTPGPVFQKGNTPSAPIVYTVYRGFYVLPFDSLDAKIIRIDFFVSRSSDELAWTTPSIFDYGNATTGFYGVQTALDENTYYQYRVQYVFADGSKSGLSPPGTSTTAQLTGSSDLNIDQFASKAYSTGLITAGIFQGVEFRTSPVWPKVQIDTESGVTLPADVTISGSQVNNINSLQWTSATGQVPIEIYGAYVIDDPFGVDDTAYLLHKVTAPVSTSNSRGLITLMATDELNELGASIQVASSGSKTATPTTGYNVVEAVVNQTGEGSIGKRLLYSDGIDASGNLKSDYVFRGQVNSALSVAGGWAGTFNAGTNVPLFTFLDVAPSNTPTANILFSFTLSCYTPTVGSVFQGTWTVAGGVGPIGPISIGKFYFNTASVHTQTTFTGIVGNPPFDNPYLPDVLSTRHITFGITVVAGSVQFDSNDGGTALIWEVAA